MVRQRKNRFAFRPTLREAPLEDRVTPNATMTVHLASIHPVVASALPGPLPRNPAQFNQQSNQQATASPAQTTAMQPSLTTGVVLATPVTTSAFSAQATSLVGVQAIASTTPLATPRPSAQTTRLAVVPGTNLAFQSTSFSIPVGQSQTVLGTNQGGVSGALNSTVPRPSLTSSAPTPLAPVHRISQQYINQVNTSIAREIGPLNLALGESLSPIPGAVPNPLLFDLTQEGVFGNVSPGFFGNGSLGSLATTRALPTTFRAGPTTNAFNTTVSQLPTPLVNPTISARLTPLIASISTVPAASLQSLLLTGSTLFNTLNSGFGSGFGQFVTG